MDDLNEQIRLHSAGATVRHKSSFADLASYQNTEQLSQDFIDTWAIPFYMRIGDTDENWVNQLIQVKDKITKDVALKLLGDFNWRTRQTGAFFAAIKNYTDLSDIIGVHLLKSEVCYAGQVYAYTFAYFNTNNCIDYLDRYSTYYLSKPNLWFDQQEALEALTYLDKINKTNMASKHADNWIKFIENKPNWNKKITTDRLEEQLALIEKVKHNK
jgi:plasmid maintenance system antidote protein VapI